MKSNGYNDLMSDLFDKSNVEKIVSRKQEEIKADPDVLPRFTVDGFEEYLRQSIEEEKRRGKNITAYDIAKECIRKTVFRILGFPMEGIKFHWLPVTLRAEIGNAVHKYVQTKYKGFTEKELTLIVPSKNVWMRADCLIGPTNIIEIKTCSYDEYSGILEKEKPRGADLYQVLIEKYLLENFGNEINENLLKRGKQLRYSDYKIDYLQFIYVCNELFSADKTIDESVRDAKLMKEKLKIGGGFWFMKVIDIDLKRVNLQKYEERVVSKLNDINRFLRTNNAPPINNEFVDKTQCPFCPWKITCDKT